MEFKITQLENEKDKEIFNKMAYESFKENIGESDESIEAEFNFLMSQFDFDDPKNGILLCKTKKNTPIGFIWISIRQPQLIIRDKHGWIYDIYVDPNYRGKKVGTKLMKHAEEWSKKKEINTIGLNVYADNHIALKLYRRLEYKDKSYVLFKELE
jgi:ribosomal protein S18 acetylase RimI-like enzyme